MSIQADIYASIGVTATMTALVIVFVSLRMYVRICVTRNYAWDDTLLLIATAFYLVFAAFGWVQNKLGDINYGTIEDQITFQKYFFYDILMYLGATSFLKLSISIFLIRLAVKKIHHWAIYAIAFIYCGSSFAFVFALIFNCDPVAYQWNKLIPNGHCKSKPDFYAACLVNAILVTFTDVALSVLPVWIIWDVQMDRRTKISVAFILGLGLVACAATVVRLLYLHAVVFSPVFTSHHVYYVTWSTLEVAVAIMAASMSTMRSLLRSICHKLGLTTNDRSTGGPGAYARSGQSWSLKKPQHNGYIQNHSADDNPEVPLRELDPRLRRPSAKPLGIQTTITMDEQERKQPDQFDMEKGGWAGVTRTDRWSVSEESLAQSHNTKNSTTPEIRPGGSI